MRNLQAGTLVTFDAILECRYLHACKFESNDRCAIFSRANVYLQTQQTVMVLPNFVCIGNCMMHCANFMHLEPHAWSAY